MTDEVVCEVNLRRPSQILDANRLFRVYRGRQRFCKCEAESLRAIYLLLSFWVYLLNYIRSVYRFHGLRMDKLYGITRKPPIKTIRLFVHIGCHQGMRINTFQDFQVDAVYVDGIIHHVLV